MILRVSPTPLLRGEIELPSSKSYSIRAFIVAACGGVSRIINPSKCEDAQVAIRVARSLGAKVRHHTQNNWLVTGGRHQAVKHVEVGESGTVLRFVLPLLALRSGPVIVDGYGTLRGRPNRHLISLLREQGVDIEGQGSEHSIPIKIKSGCLRGGRMTIEGSLSSQFISGLLIACPQLLNDTQLVVFGKRMVSGDYIEMTRQVLSQCGVKIIRKTTREFLISGGQEFTGLKRFVVPADSGLAAFFLVAASLLPSDVRLKGHLSSGLIQADSLIFDLLKRMGARVQQTKTGLRVRGPFVLRGGEFSLQSAPDLVPITAVAALFADGPTRLYNISHARAKESDRLSDLRQELLKIGARVEERPNELTIYPQKEYRRDVLLDPRHDHRLAMAFAVLGLKLGARIKDIECTRKSYPYFVKDFRKLGARAALVNVT